MRFVQKLRYGDVSKSYLAYFRATFYGIPTAYQSFFHHDVMYNCLRNPNVPRMHKKLPYNKYSSQPTTYVLYIFWVSIFAFVRKKTFYLHNRNLSFDWNTYTLKLTLCVCYGNVFLELVPTGVPTWIIFSKNDFIFRTTFFCWIFLASSRGSLL